jgi:hypothetical protein
MAIRASTNSAAHVSAELRDAITALLSNRPRSSTLTLHDVRIAVQQNGSAWSQEGELLHPQDRTSLLIEIDELIEKHGKEAPAAGFLPSGPG